ncbi:MAG: TIGR03915 family putative DNA repair protein [Bacillota bacterium]
MQKKVYTYDGSFNGLCSVLYTAYKKRDIPADIVKEKEYKSDLFYNKSIINTSEEKAKELLAKIEKNISPQSSRLIFHAYLSEIEKIEINIFFYILKGFKIGKDIDKYLTDSSVKNVQEAAGKVRRESHRIKGLLRFKQSKSDRFYAGVEPDHNILILLASHFVRRFPVQDWIIHDKKRSSAILYSSDNKTWVLTEIDSDFSPELIEFEYEIQNLWKTFFSSVSLKERPRPGLQRQFMPKKYWKNLIETPAENY